MLCAHACGNLLLCLCRHPEFLINFVETFNLKWEHSVALEAQQCLRSRYFYLICEARRELVYISEVSGET